MMWLVVGVVAVGAVGLLCVMVLPFEWAAPVGMAVVAGLFLGALFWIIELLVEIRNKLPNPPPPDPDLLAKERRGLPRRLARTRKYRLTHPHRLQKGE